MTQKRTFQKVTLLFSLSRCVRYCSSPWKMEVAMQRKFTTSPKTYAVMEFIPYTRSCYLRMNYFHPLPVYHSIPEVSQRPILHSSVLNSTPTFINSRPSA
ncbi:hypothetical protein [Parabacteroides pacaensis]|uniref:hypothetical protein n=1 Tax=Parabacteroides pacaensis TaxID=2086575 RepID=UPI00131ABCE2|nr:hypothetical protein [Parabacteroides pacaensis]